MITITYSQASALTSPVVRNLFNDQARKFPFKDAFQLSKILKDIDTEMVSYREQFKRLIKDTSGSVEPNGLIKHKNDKDRREFNAAVSAINDIEIEVPGFPLVMSDSWPDLTLAEASILSPLLKEAAGTKEEPQKPKGGMPITG